MSNARVIKSRRKKKFSDRAFDWFLIIFMVITLIITLYPFLNVLAVSFNDSVDTTKGGIGIIPRKFTISNYTEIMKYTYIATGFFNSALRTIIGTILGVICTATMAYALSRQDFVFRKPFAVLFLMTMYLGGGLIPEYMVVRQLGLVGKFAVYIIPGIIGAYNLIVIRSFIEQLPYSLEESAMIDGANDFVRFTKIILPLCLPVIATISLFIAVAQWNSWFDTYLYAPFKPELTTLQYELMKILQSAQSAAQAAKDTNSMAMQEAAGRVSPISIRMAVTVISTVPILVVYPFLQRYFVSGLTLGAVKS